MSALQTYLCSKEIKKTIISRSFEFNIPLKFICSEIGIKFDKFNDEYLSAEDSSGYKITEENFEKILSMLGMEARYMIVLKKDFDPDKTREELKKKYELNNLNKNARTAT